MGEGDGQGDWGVGWEYRAQRTGVRFGAHEGKDQKMGLWDPGFGESPVRRFRARRVRVSGDRVGYGVVQTLEEGDLKSMLGLENCERLGRDDKGYGDRAMR